MIKNDPYKILKEAKISKKLLSENALKALKEYDATLKDLKDLPEEKGLLEIAEQIEQVAFEFVEDDIKRINKELISDAAKKEQKKVQKVQSKKVSEKSQKSLDYLAECRRKLREDRQAKIASGEIKAPVKKRLTTKLKDRLKSIIGMMPKAIKEDKKKIDQTEKATMEYISKLKKIWGMNTIKPIEAELKESFDKLEEKAEKKKEDKAA